MEVSELGVKCLGLIDLLKKGVCMLTDYQKEFIKENYMKMTYVNIATELNITKRQVEKFLLKSKMKKVCRWYEFNELNDYHKNFIMGNYCHQSTSDIAKILEVPKYQVQTFIKKIGLEKNNRLFVSSDFMSREIGVTGGTIRNWIKWGYVKSINGKIPHDEFIRIKESNFTLNRKQIWNYDFFKNQNAESAYWCGFLMADGNVRRHKRRTNSTQLSLEIAIKDYEHLVRYCQSIGLKESHIVCRTRKIKYRGKNRFYKMCGVHISDVSLLDDMNIWGVCPNKTKIFVKPVINKELIGHYLRGWIDGDGCISPNGRQLVVVGNCNALLYFQNILGEIGYGGYCSVRRKKDSKYYLLRISGCKNLNKLYYLIYGHNHLRLHRKWERLEQRMLTI